MFFFLTSFALKRNLNPPILCFAVTATVILEI